MPEAESGPPDSMAASQPAGEPLACDLLDEAISSVAAACSSYLPRQELVEAACAEVRRQRAAWASPASDASFARLLPLLGRRAGPVAASVFSLLEDFAGGLPNPWPVLARLLSLEDAALSRRALEAIARAVRAGTLSVSDAVLGAMAGALDREGSGVTGEAALHVVREIVAARARAGLDSGRNQPAPGGESDLLERGSTPDIRRLAARLLDLDGPPPHDDLARRILGEEGFAVLAPALAFSRATHEDLLRARTLVDTPGGLASFQRVEHECGPSRMRELVAALGWDRVNMGLDARTFVGVSVAGSFPLALAPADAALLEGCPGARRVFERTVVVAVGGQAADPSATVSARDAVARFRAYNVAHADLLSDLLDLAPLTRDRLQKVLDTLDRLVSDFAAMFTSNRDEAAVLAGILDELRSRIEGELAGCDDDVVPIEACRLAQAFEDPAGPRDIHTLHGLKRYLHQRGLKLAFGLVPSGPRATRTVDFAVLSAARPIEVARLLEFVDLDESRAGEIAPALPESVAFIVDAFARQLLHGQRAFPTVSVFCYGNEVHYFARFRNHPAFIRVDYSPPLRGGMIDLQYLGVSNNELAWHPCPSLDAIRLIFERLDFIVEIDSTRIHARYDKERAVCMDDLVSQAKKLFGLMPYLMDVDWTVASLALPSEARRDVAGAWADFFTTWGTLPMHQFLTKDRSSVLLSIEEGAEGVREVRWTGDGAYRDRFTAQVPASCGEFVRGVLDRLQIRRDEPGAGSDLFRQLPFEAIVLEPLRQAVARGEVVETSEGPVRSKPDVFEQVHEVDRLVDILNSPAPVLAQAAQVARLVSSIERSVRFQTTGSINAYEVQRSTVVLGRRSLGVFVLRDHEGIVRLACAAPDNTLYRRRRSGEDAWQESPLCDAAGLAANLRRANYLGSGLLPPADDDLARVDEIRRRFRAPHPRPRFSAFPGERFVNATAASPGRATGQVRTGTAGRRPEDCDGAVLVTERLEPADAPFLHAATGIVSTGGGILSHLGLVAVESGRPALIVQGTWIGLTAGDRRLTCKRSMYREQAIDIPGFRVVKFLDLREVEDVICDGDLVVLDAGQGILRLLGHDPLALTFHTTLHLYADACWSLARAGPDEILGERGRRLHGRHQLERLIPRITDPGLARYGVEELLIGQAGSASGGGADLVQLLLQLMANPDVGAFARESVSQLGAALARRLAEARQRAVAQIPRATTAHDVLALRQAVFDLQQTCGQVRAILEACSLRPALLGIGESNDFDALAAERLWQLREAIRSDIVGDRALGSARRLGVVLSRLNAVLGASEIPDEAVALADAAARARAGAGTGRLSGRLIIVPGDGGIDLDQLVGGKAANLAEAARVLGEASIPGWFAVTDRAFQAALDSTFDLEAHAFGVASPGGTVRRAIENVLERSDRTPAWMAAEIQAIWRRMALPGEVANEVSRAYRELGAEAVAIRSSGLEEDTERETRAGQFETFLFIRGETRVLEVLTQAWAGLWTERAIRDRLHHYDRRCPHGGIIVQRMAYSRVSGVIQTINAAQSNPCELVINVGLGLGEGIVSGAVAADHVLVVKSDDRSAPPRFRYLTSDKRERVIYDERFGQGTVKVGTLAHQRLRPALEYPELLEVVDTATRLEQAYGSPLDIEFGFEGPRLQVLQVRPVPSALAVWREATGRNPLRVRAPVEVPS